MHSEVIQYNPGICPECGMNLLPVKLESHEKLAQSDYSKHTGHSTRVFLIKFFVSLILTIPIIIYAESRYLLLVLGSIIFFYGGWVFLIGAWRELRTRLPGMMTLIGIAITSAYLYSIYAIFNAPEHTLFWELATLITIMLLGHYFEMRAVSGAQGALKELSKLLPDTAEVIRPTVGGGKIETLPLSELREGDTVLVRPGGRVPADGVIVEGISDINESMVTGESVPVKKNIGSEVIAGTINGDGSLKIKVTKIGEGTFLAGVMRLVREAQVSKSRLQVLSDRAAFYLTIIAIGAGSLTFVLWFVQKAGFGFSLERLVAVLVIACPHALGLAVPLVASISTTLAARHGFFVKQRLALEEARNIDTVLFDKTGTLTKGEYGVVNIVGENEVLQLAASVDADSEHAAAKAIVQEAQKQGFKILPVENFKRIPGKGTSGKIGGIEIRIEGGESNTAETAINVFKNNEKIGIIFLADVIREESREAVRDLKIIGIKIAMITGDSEGVAAWVAKELKIDEYFFKVLPNEKSEKVKLLQSNGQKVAMVGDGINDAPALTQANVGIAIGAGTNVAIESAGIILLRNDPRDIVKIIKLSRLTYSKMIQNLWWATGYNIIALPLAAGVLASRGILLQPALAAMFMSISTVIVAVNAMLLRKKAI